MIIKALHFEWDEDKGKANLKKHNVSFKEARTAFYDPWSLILEDPSHSQDEERFIVLGMSNRPRLLIVCHCYRNQESAIRIISARKATKTEAVAYQKHRGG